MVKRVWNASGVDGATLGDEMPQHGGLAAARGANEDQIHVGQLLGIFQAMAGENWVPQANDHLWKRMRNQWIWDTTDTGPEILGWRRQQNGWEGNRKESGIKME